MRLSLVALATFLGFVSTASLAESVLVFGGTGRLGAAIVQDLVKDGHQVAVFARPTSDRSRLKGLKVAYLQGDLGKPDDVTAAIESGKFTVLIDAAARRTGDNSYSHAVTMPRIVQAARASGAKQIIFLSSVGAGDNIKLFPKIDWTEYLPLLKERGAAERALISSGVPYTIIRTGAVLLESVPSTGKARFTEDQSTIGAITRPDLAVLTADCVGKAACFNKIYHAADDTLNLPRKE